MGKKIKPIWFQVKNGKTHELVEDVDIKRFPLGRAKCAPFSRHVDDVLFDDRKNVDAIDMCRLCVLAK